MLGDGELLKFYPIFQERTSSPASESTFIESKVRIFGYDVRISEIFVAVFSLAHCGGGASFMHAATPFVFGPKQPTICFMAVFPPFSSQQQPLIKLAHTHAGTEKTRNYPNEKERHTKTPRNKNRLVYIEGETAFLYMFCAVPQPFIKGGGKRTVQQPTSNRHSFVH